ncbi:MAG TPA: hypothetical protein VGG34_11460 [Opitutaceae bacterium]|jgi:hypothetical protein
MFPFEYPVRTYQESWSEFDGGDKITIVAIRGNRPQIEVGGLYAVMGTFALSSMDKAILGLYVTGTGGPARTFPSQRRKISKGGGTFLLWFLMSTEGEPHVSFYPAASGFESRGGTYFAKTWESRRFDPSHPNALGSAKPVFRFYLPKAGHVKIGRPVFKNFLDSEPPR